MIHAELGLLDMTARRRRSELVHEVVSWADLQSGLQAALAIVAAIRHRDRTGEPQFIDVAMAEVMLQMTEWTAVELAGGEGGRHSVFGAFNAPIVTLADGTRAVVPGDVVTTWPRWLEVIGDDELASDSRFESRETRAANRPEMMAAIEAWASTVPDFAAFDELTGRAQLVAGQIRPVTDVLDADWAGHREALIDVGHDEALLLPRTPFRYSSLAAGTHGRPVHQGADNRQVLSELLALTDDEIDRLERDGVLVERRSDR